MGRPIWDRWPSLDRALQVTVAGELATLAKGQHRSLACCCLGRDVVWCGQASVGSIMAVEIWPWLLGDEAGSDGWKFNGKWAAAGCCGRRLVGDGAGANGTPADGFGRGEMLLTYFGEEGAVIVRW
ncbi:hypothetical protein ACLOJK_038519 [Asimina triloba]